MPVYERLFNYLELGMAAHVFVCVFVCMQLCESARTQVPFDAFHYYV